MLEGEVAALICRCGTDNRHIRDDAFEIEPVLALKVLMHHNRLGARTFIHGAALESGVNKCIQPHLGQHAGALGRRFAVHIK